MEGKEKFHGTVFSAFALEGARMVEEMEIFLRRAR
jgi:hypothetical protein